MENLLKKKEEETAQEEIPPSLEFRVTELEKNMARLKASNAHLFHCEDEETEEVESSGVVTGDEE